MKCKDCEVILTKQNWVFRNDTQNIRPYCKGCKKNRNLTWQRENKEKRKAILDRYNLKKGVGVKAPCTECGEICKKRPEGYICSTRCSFMSKVDVKEGCWEWQGALDEGGYGKFKKDGKTQKAHRVAYEMFTEAISPGLIVCHMCDNPKCVNPSHLWIGTQRDNMRDRSEKGRAPSHNGHKRKLNRERVLMIRDLHEKGNSQRSIGKILKHPTHLIHCVVNRKTWRHVK